MRHFLRIALVALFSVSLGVAAEDLEKPFGQGMQPLAPKAAPPQAKPRAKAAKPPAVSPSKSRKPPSETSRVKLKGLVFTTDGAAIRKSGGPPVTGVQAQGVPLLDSPEFAERMQQYLGKPLTKTLISQVLNTTSQFYVRHDQPFVRVLTPPQELTRGVLQVQVIESRLGTLTVEGNRWFPDSAYSEPILWDAAENLSKQAMDAAIEAINANPFRSADVTFEAGKQPGTTDITVVASDRLPIRSYVGYENSGFATTGVNRYFTGFNWGNAFMLGHSLDYQFTMGDDFNVFQSHTASYTIPYPWGHSLQLVGGYSKIRGIVPAPFALNGESSQVGLRYGIPLPTVGNFRESLTGGYDWKNSNNNLLFGGTTVTASSTTISQFLVSYAASFEDRLGGTSASATLVHSPGGMVNNNTDAIFALSRVQASADYSYFTLALSRMTNLPWELSWAIRGSLQVATQNLLGSEQMGIGGNATVRGYRERLENGDEGFMVSNEFWSPTFRFPVPGCDTLTQAMQFLTFVDYGVVSNVNLVPGEGESRVLSSVGTGMRYSINPHLQLRADWGFPLADNAFDTNTSRVHVGVTLGF